MVEYQVGSGVFDDNYLGFENLCQWKKEVGVWRIVGWGWIVDWGLSSVRSIVDVQVGAIAVLRNVMLIEVM